MSWLLAIGGFAMLVVLHEAGHFFAAKAVGMRVERFFLFFPPKVVSFTRGETEYGIGAVPLGGFVKITGMNPEEEIYKGETPREDLPPDELRALEALEARAYYRQPPWKRIFVIFAGPLVNIVLALVIFFVIASGFGLNGDVVNRVDSVSDGAPAAAVLEEGDRLVKIDGKDLTGLEGMALVDQVRGVLAERTCEGRPRDGCEATEPVALVVERGERRIRAEITPTLTVPPASGAAEAPEPRMLLGFRYDAERVKLGPAESAEFAVDRSWEITARTAEVFARIFDAEQRSQITSAVGATEVARQSFEFDTRQAIGVLGIISLSLGLVNLLPFLPLDGGHIFWSVVEKLNGRRPSMQIMERSGMVGFVLIMIIFFIGLNNDIGRITGDGFDVR